jgi:asparagine N-glycosylation enzyme membrane subunit Stt3
VEGVKMRAIIGSILVGFSLVAGVANESLGRIAYEITNLEGYQTSWRGSGLLGGYSGYGGTGWEFLIWFFMIIGVALLVWELWDIIPKRRIKRRKAHR